ncbi:enoyl-CoA hydratase/isomerase family protein [Amycolatopsis sp. lyj-23]|uniref:enoyl-CoA hydratase/isomerase family protein n=1 Tax=Amycolatopsis sp. lyj-23 TaxID=2789283 RepID=UPI00397BB93D
MAVTANEAAPGRTDAVVVAHPRPSVIRVTLAGHGGHRLDRDTVSALLAAVDQAEATPGARVLVLDAAGETFCAGLALDELAGDAWRPVIAAVHRLLSRLVRSPLVTVAVVDGAAIGGGVGLAAACDQVIAGRRARFRLTEVVLGLVPALVLPLVVQRAGPAKALSLALTAPELLAPDALACGLADQLADDAERALNALLARLRATDPRATRAVKSYHAALTERGPAPEPVVMALLAERFADPGTRTRLARFGGTGRSS